MRSAAARRYAKALFSIAREAERVEAVRGQLDGLAEILEASPELQGALFRPLHPAAQRKAVLHALCERLGAGPDVRHFYDFLVDQRRMIHFPAIREEYGRLADEAAGRVPARVRSAAPLDDAQTERLRHALCERTGRDVELVVDVDPELIGGVVAQVGDLVFDGSIRTHLQQLRSNLTREH